MTAMTAVLLVAGCRGGGWAGLFEPRNTFVGANEEWTILCADYRGAAGRAAADDMAEGLRKTPGVDSGKVSVQGDEQQAQVLYGKYVRQIDPHSRERSEISAEMTRDLQMLRGLRDHDGRQVFLGARFIPMPGPPAAAPADWDLRNAQAVYTLQVGVYYNTEHVPDRKLAAVEKVKALREKGHEAYYYHGESRSMVTVGRFGESAVVPLKRSPTRSENTVQEYSAEVESLRQKPECMYNLTNDDLWYNVDERGRKVPVRSMLVRVPRSGAGR